jgi:hypothetical protein
VLAPTGLQSVNAQGDAGFDIHYASQGANGQALAALNVNGTRNLYRVDLLTGKARRIGAFPANRQVTDLTAGFRRDELQGIFIFGECLDGVCF